MNYNLVSSLHGPLALKSSVPTGFSSMIIPGSEIASAEGEFGHLLFQEIQSDQFSINFNVYRILQDISLQYTTHTDALHAHILLKNNLRYYIEGIGNITLREGQFNIFHSPKAVSTVYFEKGNEYRTFNTYYSSDILIQLFPFFPQLQNFLRHTNGSPTLLFDNAGWTTIQIVDIITNLLQCPYDETMRRFYIDHKVKELLFLLLIQKFTAAAVHTRLTRHDREAIHEAKSIIEKNTSQHITSRKIAQEVGMNEFKLKNFFKQVFGMGMFEFMVQVRMQKARVLLLDTDKPIKEIATLTGYTSMQNFQTAFRKYFNCTPASLRKQ
jgi:AraC family transcriptional regulator, transcriptional activator of the genes for pyochelin and ferripyochelin receptors